MRPSSAASSADLRRRRKKGEPTTSLDISLFDTLEQEVQRVTTSPNRATIRPRSATPSERPEGLDARSVERRDAVRNAQHIADVSWVPHSVDLDPQEGDPAVDALVGKMMIRRSVRQQYPPEGGFREEFNLLPTVEQPHRLLTTHKEADVLPPDEVLLLDSKERVRELISNFQDRSVAKRNAEDELSAWAKTLPEKSSTVDLAARQRLVEMDNDYLEETQAVSAIETGTDHLETAFGNLHSFSTKMFDQIFEIEGQRDAELDALKNRKKNCRHAATTTHFVVPLGLTGKQRSQQSASIPYGCQSLPDEIFHFGTQSNQLHLNGPSTATPRGHSAALPPSELLNTTQANMVSSMKANEEIERLRELNDRLMIERDNFQRTWSRRIESMQETIDAQDHVIQANRTEVQSIFEELAAEVLWEERGNGRSAADFLRENIPVLIQQVQMQTRKDLEVSLFHKARSDAQREVDEVKHSVSAVKKELREKEAERNAVVDVCRQEISIAKTAQEKSLEESEALRDNMKRILSEKATLSNELANMKRKLEDKERVIEKLEAEIQTSNSEAVAAKLQLSQRVTAIQKNAEQMMRRTTEDLQHQVKTFGDQLNIEANECERLRKELATSKATTQQTIKDLEQKINDLRLRNIDKKSVERLIDDVLVTLGGFVLQFMKQLRNSALKDGGNALRVGCGTIVGQVLKSFERALGQCKSTFQQHLPREVVESLTRVESQCTWEVAECAKADYAAADPSESIIAALRKDVAALREEHAAATEELRFLKGNMAKEKDEAEKRFACVASLFQHLHGSVVRLSEHIQLQLASKKEDATLNHHLSADGDSSGGGEHQRSRSPSVSIATWAAPTFTPAQNELLAADPHWSSDVQLATECYLTARHAMVTLLKSASPGGPTAPTTGGAIQRTVLGETQIDGFYKDFQSRCALLQSLASCEHIVTLMRAHRANQRTVMNAFVQPIKAFLTFILGGGVSRSQTPVAANHLRSPNATNLAVNNSSLTPRTASLVVTPREDALPLVGTSSKRLILARRMIRVLDAFQTKLASTSRVTLVLHATIQRCAARIRTFETSCRLLSEAWSTCAYTVKRRQESGGSQLAPAEREALDKALIGCAEQREKWVLRFERRIETLSHFISVEVQRVAMLSNGCLQHCNDAIRDGVQMMHQLFAEQMPEYLGLLTSDRGGGVEVLEQQVGELQHERESLSAELKTLKAELEQAHLLNHELQHGGGLRGDDAAGDAGEAQQPGPCKPRKKSLINSASGRSGTTPSTSRRISSVSPGTTPRPGGNARRSTVHSPVPKLLSPGDERLNGDVLLSPTALHSQAAGFQTPRDDDEGLRAPLILDENPTLSAEYNRLIAQLGIVAEVLTSELLRDTPAGKKLKVDQDILMQPEGSLRAVIQEIVLALRAGAVSENEPSNVLGQTPRYPSLAEKHLMSSLRVPPLSGFAQVSPPTALQGAGNAATDMDPPYLANTGAAGGSLFDSMLIAHSAPSSARQQLMGTTQVFSSLPTALPAAFTACGTQTTASMPQQINVAASAVASHVVVAGTQTDVVVILDLDKSMSEVAPSPVKSDANDLQTVESPICRVEDVKPPLQTCAPRESLSNVTKFARSRRLEATTAQQQQLTTDKPGNPPSLVLTSTRSAGGTGPGPLQRIQSTLKDASCVITVASIGAQTDSSLLASYMLTLYRAGGETSPPVQSCAQSPGSSASPNNVVADLRELNSKVSTTLRISSASTICTSTGSNAKARPSSLGRPSSAAVLSRNAAPSLLAVAPHASWSGETLGGTLKPWKDTTPDSQLQKANSSLRKK